MWIDISSNEIDGPLSLPHNLIGELHFDLLESYIYPLIVEIVINVPEEVFFQ